MLREKSLKILELDRGRSEELGSQFDTVELLALGGISHRASTKILEPAALEAVALVLVVHFLPLGKACAGNVQQGILFAAINREVVVTALAGIHELDVDVLPDPFQVPVMPHLKRECCSTAAPLVLRTLVISAGRVRINIVWLAKSNIDVAAVGPPPRFARREVLVGIGNSTVVLFPVLVFGGIRVGVAAQPEGLDEGVALLIVAQTHEGSALFVGDDIGNFLVQPGFVGSL